MSPKSNPQRLPAAWVQACLLTCAVLLLMLAPAHARIYKWTDRNGKVHFTDNIEAVPPEYRDQVEERASTPPPAHTPKTPSNPLSSRSSKPPSSGKPYAVKHHPIPLLRVGNAMFVEAVLDGFLELHLQVDTGAGLTVISTKAARLLALNLDNAKIVPLQSASGTFQAPFTKVKSITVGGATVHDVEVVVHDIVPEDSVGLLGMSFLSNFQVTINAEERAMVLTEFVDVPGEALYGGRPEDWWRLRFRYYRRQIEVLEAEIRKQPSPKLAETLQDFQAKLDALDRKATLAAVPRQWRY